MSKCTKKNCPMVKVSADCDLKDCPYRTEADQSKDIIYREDAIEAVKELNAISFYELNEHSKEAFTEIRKALKALPSADRPQGEWERIPYSFVGGYRCSICGQKSLENHWNFCPRCGARMKGADDEV